MGDRFKILLGTTLNPKPRLSEFKILKHKKVLGLVFIKKQKNIAKNVLELKISKPTYIV